MILGHGCLSSNKSHNLQLYAVRCVVVVEVVIERKAWNRDNRDGLRLMGCEVVVSWNEEVDEI